MGNCSLLELCIDLFCLKGNEETYDMEVMFMNETIKLEVNGKSKQDGFLIEHQ